MPHSQKIIGRVQEQTSLKNALYSPQAELIAIYGRRRIGKTFLIREYFTKEQKTSKQEILFFYATGEKDGSMHNQIANFTQEIGATFYSGAPLEVKNNWKDTFQFLTNAMKSVSPDKKIVLFFDEFPWLVTRNSHLRQTFEYYWNHHWSRDSRIKVIICGSSAGWILKNIVNNKGGLYNRVTKTLKLEPFNLYETQEYLKSRKIALNKQQIADVYMVLGGIPFYLSQLESGLTATQNIEKLAFSNNGFLIREFSNLYATLFEESQKYIELARIISSYPYGIEQEELIKKAKLQSGGRAIEWLSDLEQAGFISRFIPFLSKKKGISYRLTDEYSLFYFKWIEPIERSLLKQGMRSGYWSNLQSTQAWKIWKGYAFEILCYKHISQISQGLHLSPMAVPYDWRYAPKKISQENIPAEHDASDRGAQIDLLFDREDGAITICEIKYTQTAFAIDKSYAEQLKNKLKVFQKVTRTKKQLFLSLISANGIKETKYSEILGNCLELESLFKPVP